MFQYLEPEFGRAVEPSAELSEFLDFLDDRTPAMFVADSVSAILRTDEPITYGTDRAVEIVANWAKSRAHSGGPAMPVLLVRATRKIVEAYRAHILTGVDPKAFYRPFVAGLAAVCTDEERALFHSGLQQLRELAAERRDSAPTAEFETTDAVDLVGRPARREDSVSSLARRIESQPQMPASEFSTVVADIDRSLVSRAGVPIRSSLARLATAGLALFNAGEVARAATVFELVHVLMERLRLTPSERDEVRCTLRGAQLDQRRLTKWLGDKELRSDIAPIIQFFADLDPIPVLDRLEHEPSREQRRLLLGIMELHGDAALPVLVDRLERAASSSTWYFARNLIYLVAHLEPADDGARRRLVSLLNPYVTSPVAQLRGVALAALGRVGGREIVPALSRALDPGAYKAATLEAERGVVERHLSQALEMLAALDVESALAVVAEFAIGARGEKFGIGKSLRDAAILALETRKRRLPRRAVLVIVDFLRQQSDRKIKFVVGGMSLGVDLVGCRRLMKLISGSTEPEAADVLATAFLRRLSERGTAELSSAIDAIV